MGVIDLTNLPFSKANFTKLLGALRDSNRSDYDSGWKATPTDKTFRHNLGVLPGNVTVYSSDNKDGSSYINDTATAVTKLTITITGPKAYCRVLANK